MKDGGIKMKERFENIDLNSISLSLDETHHLYNRQPLYDKIFLNVMSFHPPGAAAVKDDNGAYHINLKGEQIYKKKFIKTFGYYSDIAAVEDESGWYHIDLKGNPVYNERYKWVGNFQEERCPVRDINGRYFHIKKDGVIAYNNKYNYVGDYKYGIAVVYNKDGYARHIDMEGNYIYNKLYEELGVFHKGFAIAKDNQGYFHINKLGDPIYLERYKWVEPFYNGYSFASKFTGEKVIIDELGRINQYIINENIEVNQKFLRKKLMDMLVGYWKTQILYSIVKFEILDHIEKGINTFVLLLNKIKIAKNSLNMIIKVLMLWNFIDERECKYYLKYLGKLLTENNPISLKYATLMWGDDHYLVMSRLLEALKTYKPQFKEIFEMDLFHHFDKNKEKRLIYNRAMEEYSFDYDNLLELYDFSDTKIILDIGGGSGKLLTKILKKNTSISKGILFDLPNSIENAQKLWKDSDFYSRLEFISGDFFEKIPVKVDTIIMSRIIHDWSNDKAIKILKNIYKSLEKDGKLLLFEIIVPEKIDSDIGITSNFNLLVCVGGKERTLNEFKNILNKAGFIISDVIKDEGVISIIVAQKKKR